MDRNQIYQDIFGPIHENAERLRQELKMQRLASKPNTLLLRKLEELKERKIREKEAERIKQGLSNQILTPPTPSSPEIMHPFHYQDTHHSTENNNNTTFTIDDIITRPIAGPTSHPLIRPYSRGEDINQDYRDYLRASRINGYNATPVLGEDANFYLGLRAIASGMSTLFEGKSRSGKTLLLNRIKDLLPSFVEIGGASNNALLDRADEINGSGFVIYSEYQSVVDGNPRIKEATKCISEDADYHFTSLGATKTLNGNTIILGTSADENKKTQNRDVEVSGRFIILRTGSSQEKIRMICDYQDGIADGTLDEIVFSGDRLNRLKDHYISIMKNRGTPIENPFAKAYSEALPETQKSLYYRTLYHGLINGSTRFDAHNRIEKEERLFTNLSDIFLVHHYYHNAYCDTLKRLSTQSYQAIIKSNEHQAEELKAAYEHEIGLIDKIKTKIVDWEKIWRSGLAHMESRNPGLAEEWTALQSKDGYVQITDPIKNESITLCEVR